MNHSDCQRIDLDVGLLGNAAFQAARAIVARDATFGLPEFVERPGQRLTFVANVYPYIWHAAGENQPSEGYDNLPQALEVALAEGKPTEIQLMADGEYLRTLFKLYERRGGSTGLPRTEGHP